MATQAHNIWLILGSEWPNIIRKQNPKFLAFSPMRTKFTKKVNQAVLIAKDKGVPGVILPTKIHRCGFKKTIPSVQDVLADVVQQIVHREGFHVMWMDQDVVGEQSKFLPFCQEKVRILMWLNPWRHHELRS